MTYVEQDSAEHASPQASIAERAATTIAAAFRKQRARRQVSSADAEATVNTNITNLERSLEEASAKVTQVMYCMPRVLYQAIILQISRQSLPP